MKGTKRLNQIRQRLKSLLVILRLSTQTNTSQNISPTVGLACALRLSGGESFQQKIGDSLLLGNNCVYFTSVLDLS